MSKSSNFLILLKDTINLVFMISSSDGNLYHHRMYLEVVKRTTESKRRDEEGKNLL